MNTQAKVAYADECNRRLTALDYTFFGVPCTQIQFAEYLAKRNNGECPFCGRQGLKKQYGSDKKHIKSCAKKSVRP